MSSPWSEIWSESRDDRLALHHSEKVSIPPIPWMILHCHHTLPTHIRCLRCCTHSGAQDGWIHRKYINPNINPTVIFVVNGGISIVPPASSPWILDDPPSGCPAHKQNYMINTGFVGTSIENSPSSKVSESSISWINTHTNGAIIIEQLFELSFRCDRFIVIFYWVHLVRELDCWRGRTYRRGIIAIRIFVWILNLLRQTTSCNILQSIFWVPSITTAIFCAL